MTKFVYSPYCPLYGERLEPMKYAPTDVSPLNRAETQQQNMKRIFRELEDMLNRCADEVRKNAWDHPHARQYIDYLRGAANNAGSFYDQRSKYDILKMGGVILAYTRHTEKIMREIASWIAGREQERSG